MTCSTFPDFSLASSQSIRGINNFNNFLLLENSQGKKKVIIPNQKILVGKTGALTNTVCLEKDHSKIPKEESKFFSYNLNKNHKLQSSHSANNLFLSYILLQEKEYLSAQKYFKRYISQAKKYSPIENSLFLRIQELHASNKDPSPEACTVYLNAMIAKFKNISLYSEEPLKIEKEELTSLYKEYIHYLDSMDYLEEAQVGKTSIYQTPFILSKDEEILILQTFHQANAYSARFLAREQFLECTASSSRVQAKILGEEEEVFHINDLKEILKLFEKLILEEKTNAQSFNPDSCPLLRPGETFHKHFILFYRHIQSAPPSSAINIKQILKLMSNDHTADQNLRYFLEDLIDDPQKYPPPELLFSTEENKKLWKDKTLIFYRRK